MCKAWYFTKINFKVSKYIMFRLSGLWILKIQIGSVLCIIEVDIMPAFCLYCVKRTFITECNKNFIASWSNYYMYMNCVVCRLKGQLNMVTMKMRQRNQGLKTLMYKRYGNNWQQDWMLQKKLRLLLIISSKVFCDIICIRP